MTAELLPVVWPTLSSPLPDARLRAVSFGAGVQSTTMLMLAATGQIGPMPDVAIFADTGDEPAEVYDHLDFMRSGNLGNLGIPFPIEIVSAGNIREQLLGWSRGATDHANGRPPFFVASKDRRGRLKVGQTNRQCTQDWKIRPIERRLRELVDIKAPKSACRICPYHADSEWLALSPVDFEAACEVDDALRVGRLLTRGEPYLHRSCKPLREVNFNDRTPPPISWLGECEGMCGV